MSSKLDKLIASYNSMECEFNLDKSIEVCKEILKINPNLIEFQENLACDYYNKKEYEKSIELFNKCIENGGARDDSYMMIALAYVKLNHPEKALEIIKETKDKELAREFDIPQRLLRKNLNAAYKKLREGLEIEDPAQRLLRQSKTNRREKGTYIQEDFWIKG